MHLARIDLVNEGFLYGSDIVELLRCSTNRLAEEFWAQRKSVKTGTVENE